MEYKKIKIPEPLKKYVIHDMEERFTIIDTIAKGGQGTVWLATDSHKNKFAIKEIQLEPDNSIRQIKRYLLECASLMRAQHQFIVSFCGMTDEYPFQIVTKYVGPVNLTCFLTNKHFRSQSKNGTHLTKIAMSISNAMVFLHKINIIHRDLKPSNILLGKDYLPRICDLGLIHEIDHEKLMTSELGTPIWMAPEVIRGEYYTEKCDVFSFSIILYQMATKILPLAELTSTIIMEKYKNELYRPSFPDDLKIPIPLQNLIVSCWSENPNERPSFQQIFDKFASGEVYFSNYRPKEIKKFAKKLIKEDQKRKLIPPFEVFSYKKSDDPYSTSKKVQNSKEQNKKDQKKTNEEPKTKSEQNKEQRISANGDDNKRSTNPNIIEKKKHKKESDSDESYSQKDDLKRRHSKKKRKKESDSDDEYSDSKKKHNRKKPKKESDSDDEYSDSKRKHNRKKPKKESDSDEEYSDSKRRHNKKKHKKESDSDEEYSDSKRRHDRKKPKKASQPDDMQSDSDEQDGRKRRHSKKRPRNVFESDELYSDSDELDVPRCSKNGKGAKAGESLYTAYSDEDFRLKTKAIREKRRRNRNFGRNGDSRLSKTRAAKMIPRGEEAIDYKGERIFDVGTFETESKKGRGRQSLKKSPPKTYRSCAAGSRYGSDDYSSSARTENASETPRYKTHVTSDKKRRPAPSLQVEPDPPDPSRSYSSDGYCGWRGSERKEGASPKYFPIDSPRYASCSPVSIDALSDATSPLFRVELEKVRRKDFPRFMRVLKSHLTSSTPRRELILLLRKTNELLENDDESRSCLSLFSEKKIFEFLPISGDNRNGAFSGSKKIEYKSATGSGYDTDTDNRSSSDELIDLSIEILNKVCQFCPEFIGEDFKTTMLPLINARPVEAARLLKVYSSSFETVENPWPLLDMLIVHKKKFATSEAGSIVIRTIVNLIQTSKTYRKSRMDDCRKVLTFFMNSPVKKNVISAYGAVAALYDKEFDLPFKKIRIDMEDSETVNSVISLFDRMESVPSVKSIILSLLKTARKNERASEILIKMAKHEFNSAAILIDCQSVWLNQKLPSFESTFRVFLAAVSDYDDLCKTVISDSIFIAELFCLSCRQIESDDLFISYEKVLARIDFNPDFVEYLRQYKFFSFFFRHANEIEDDRAKLASIRTVKFLIEIENCDEFNAFLKSLRKMASGKGKIAAEAQSCIDLMNSSKKRRK